DGRTVGAAGRATVVVIRRRDLGRIDRSQADDGTLIEGRQLHPPRFIGNALHSVGISLANSLRVPAAAHTLSFCALLIGIAQLEPFVRTGGIAAASHSGIIVAVTEQNDDLAQ